MSTRKLWLLAIMLAVLVLTGCAGGANAAQIGSSWPGITASEEAVYLAFGAHVFAIDPDSGDDLWRFPAEPQRSQVFFAPPAVEDNLVVVADYEGNVFGLDPENGNQKWVFDAPVTGKFVGGATIGDDLVYIGHASGVMYALDKSDGVLVWEFAAQRDIWSAPLLDEGTLYITTLDRHLYALNAETGGVEWQYPADDVNPEESPSGAMVGTPNLHDGVLYFGDFGPAVHAFSIEDHELLWTHETTNWVWSSPILDEETGFLIGGDLDGNIFALNSDNGDVEWTFEAAGPVVSAPVIAEYEGQPAVFITSGDSNLYILDPEDGDKLGEIDVTVEFPTRFLFVETGTSVRPVPLYAAPIIFDDKVLIGTHEGTNPLMAYDIDNLDRLWAFDPNAQ